MDIEKMNTTIDKIKIYKNQIDINLNNISENFKSTSYYYITSNTEKLTNLQEQLKEKFNDSYNKTSMTVSQMFEDIN